MALREDRAWKGVPDPQAIREALENGEPEAYNGALDAIDGELRSTAVTRSVAWIGRSVPAFPRDAMTNLIAIAENIGDCASAADTLRPTAVKVVLLADRANLTRTTPALARFLLDSTHPTVRRSDVASAFAGLVAPEEEDEEEHGPFGQGVLLALRLAASEIPTDRLKVVRAKITGYSDDDLAFVWEPDVDLILVTGPIAEAYAKRLAGHDMLEGVGPPIDLVLGRVTAFVEAGGKEPSLTTVAAEVAKQLGAATAVLTPEAIGYLRRLPGVLANTSGAEVDALASNLASSARGNPGDLLDIALRLDVAAAVRTSIVTAVGAWLATPTLEVADAKTLLAAHGSALRDEGVVYVTPLAAQWINRAERGFGALAVELSPEEAAPALIAALAAGAAGPAYPSQVAEATTLIGSDDDGHLTALVAQVAGWVGTTGTPPTLTALGTGVRSLQTTGVDCSPIHAALQSRLEAPAIAPVELLALAGVVIAWDGQGILVPGTLAASVAIRLAAVGVVDAEAAQWAARRTNGSPSARLLMVATVRDSATPVAEAVAAADATYGVFRHHACVAAALVARAAAEAGEGETRQLLDQAVRWKRPRTNRTDFEANLSAISTAKPEMDALVNDLRRP
jgi:hypothetical protein